MWVLPGWLVCMSLCVSFCFKTRTSKANIGRTYYKTNEVNRNSLLNFKELSVRTFWERHGGDPHFQVRTDVDSTSFRMKLRSNATSRMAKLPDAVPIFQRDKMNRSNGRSSELSRQWKWVNLHSSKTSWAWEFWFWCPHHDHDLVRLGPRPVKQLFCWTADTTDMIHNKTGF